MRKILFALLLCFALGSVSAATTDIQEIVTPPGCGEKGEAPLQEKELPQPVCGEDKEP
ncbi:MAG: hypothetical protein AAF518_14120 [Spirochaetota bacterium]